MWYMQLGRFKFLILNCNFYLTPTFIVKFYILLSFIYLFIHLCIYSSVYYGSFFLEFKSKYF